MQEDGTHREPGEALQCAESVRLLWEATRQVVYGGIDTDDLGALCSIVVRLAEHRLLRLQASAGSSEALTAIERLRDYRESALKLLSSMKSPVSEPDWSAIADKLASVGAAPLEFRK